MEAFWQVQRFETPSAWLECKELWEEGWEMSVKKWRVISHFIPRTARSHEEI